LILTEQLSEFKRCDFQRRCTELPRTSVCDRLAVFTDGCVLWLYFILPYLQPGCGAAKWYTAACHSTAPQCAVSAQYLCFVPSSGEDNWRLEVGD